MRMTSPTELLQTPSLDAAWSDSLLKPDQLIDRETFWALDVPFDLADDEEEEDEDDDEDEDDEDLDEDEEESDDEDGDDEDDDLDEDEEKDADDE